MRPLSSVDDAVRQIQAPELVDDAVQVEPMVGRARRAPQPPEAEALFRTDPDLDELVAGDLERARPEEVDRREA